MSLGSRLAVGKCTFVVFCIKYCGLPNLHELEEPLESMTAAKFGGQSSYYKSVIAAFSE